MRLTILSGQVESESGLSPCGVVTKVRTGIGSFTLRCIVMMRLRLGMFGQEARICPHFDGAFFLASTVCDVCICSRAGALIDRLSDIWM